MRPRPGKFNGMQAPGFHVVVQKDVRLVRLIGELDLAAVDAATEGIAPLLDAPGSIEFDLSELSFMDSSGIRVLVQTKEALGDGEALVLSSPSDHVAKILEIAGISALGIEIRGSMI